MKNKAFILTKVSLQNNYGFSRITRNGGKERNRTLGMAVIIFIAVASIVACLSLYYWLIAAQLADLGALDLMLALIVVAVSVVTLFFSIYKAPGYLYAFRDFDLLMSLPVRPRAVLTSKIAALYVSNLMFAMCVAVPGVVIYGIQAGATPQAYVTGILLLFFVPVIPMLIGSAFALPIAKISSKSRRSNAVMLILCMALVVGISVGSFALSAVSPEQMGQSLLSIDGILKYYFPANWYIDAVSGGSAFFTFMLAFLSAAVFIIFVMAFARMFKTINSSMNERFSRSDFKLKTMKASSALGALVKKEVKFYFSSYVYVLNTSIGMILFLVYAVALPFLGYEEVAAMLGLPAENVFLLAATCALGAFCIAISLVTAPSVSVEGRSLWILKSLPVSFREIAKGKIILHLIITMPLTFAALTFFAVSMGVGFFEYAAVLLLLLSFCVFSALVGLIINLYFPKLEWKSQTQAVKQSSSVLITMVITMAAVVLAGLGCFFSGLDFVLFCWALTPVILVISLLLWVYLSKRGDKIFLSL